jgi:hypothetical protein
VALVLVGGCGGGGGAQANGIEKLSADKALAKVKAAAATVTSVHVKGTLSQGTQTLGIDVQLGSGKGAGTLSASGHALEVRLLDGTVYVRGDAATFEAFGAPAAQASLAGGKWLKSPATSGSFTSFSGFLEIKGLFDSLLSPDGTVKLGKSTTINGTKALTLVDTASTGGSLYVAETGKALPLRVERGGAAGGHIDFTDYGSAVTVTAPAGAVDISQLGQ